MNVLSQQHRKHSLLPTIIVTLIVAIKNIIWQDRSETKAKQKFAKTKRHLSCRL